MEKARLVGSIDFGTNQEPVDLYRTESGVLVGFDGKYLERETPDVVYMPTGEKVRLVDGPWEE